MLYGLCALLFSDFAWVILADVGFATAPSRPEVIRRMVETPQQRVERMDKWRNLVTPSKKLAAGHASISADSFRRFLTGLRIWVPTESIPDVHKVGLTFDFNNLHIKDINITGIKSSVHIESSTLNVEVNGVTAFVKGALNCTGWMKRPVNFLGTVHDAVLRLGVQVNRTDDGKYPDSLSIVNCNLKADIKDFHLYGVFKVAEPVVKGVVHRLIARTVCPSVSRWLSDHTTALIRNVTRILESPNPVKAPPVEKRQRYWDATRSPLMRFIDTFVQEDIGSEGAGHIIKILASALDQSEANKRPLTLDVELQSVYNRKALGHVRVNFTNFSMVGYDKVKSLRVPDSDHMKEPVAIGLSASAPQVSAKVIVGVRLTLVDRYADYPLESRQQVDLSLEDVQLMLSVFAKFISSRLPPASPATWRIPCVLCAMDDLRFADVGATFLIKALTLQSMSAANDSLEHDLDVLANNAAALAKKDFNKFVSEGILRLFSPRIKDVVDDTLHQWATHLQNATMNDYQLKQIEDGVLPTAQKSCQIIPGVSAISKVAWLSCAVAFCGTLMVSLFVMLVWIPFQDEIKESIGTRHPIRWHCLATETDIIWYTFLLPCFILCLILLQFWAHTLPGSTVMLILERNGQKQIMPPFAVTAFAKSFAMLWNKGLHGVAITSLMLGGVFPYAKLLAFLYAWLAPPKHLSVKARGRLIRVIDGLGKWNFMSFFTTVLTVSSHQVVFTIGASSAKIKQQPLRGFYFSLYVLIFTTLLGHLLLHFHRHSEAKDASTVIEAVERMSSICTKQPKMERGLRFLGNTIKTMFMHFGWGVHNDCVIHSIPFLLVAAGVVLGIGFSMDIIEFKHHGLVGLLTPAATQRYSVPMLAGNLPEVTVHGGQVRWEFIRSFQILVLFFGDDYGVALRASLLCCLRCADAVHTKKDICGLGTLRSFMGLPGRLCYQRDISF